MLFFIPRRRRHTRLQGDWSSDVCSSDLQGDAYVRIKPHEERTLSFTKLWRETKKGNPFNAFKGNYTQQDVMQEARRRLRKYAPMRTSVRNGRSFNFGTGGRSDVDFVFRGPDTVAVAGYGDERGERSEKICGIVDAGASLKRKQRA